MNKKPLTREQQEELTRLGNPRKPQGEEGEAMLSRMNESHYAVTGWALSHWKIQKNDRILDIGCGGGATLKRMAEEITDGHLTGVDYSPVSVRESSILNTEEIASGKLSVLEASVESLPFEDNTFDKVITVESFYFWPDPVENLKEVRRILKPGGTFLLVADIYGKDGLSEDILENIRQYSLLNPTIEEFRQMFTKAGFSEILVHTKEGTDWICVEGR